MAKKKGISDAEFSRQFTKLIVRHLGKLPPSEQDRLICKAQRAASKIDRAASSTTEPVRDREDLPLIARSPE